jgi:MGT family glycosyltransferase
VVPPRDDLPSAFSGRSIADVGLADRFYAVLLRTWPGLAQGVNGSRSIAAMRRARGLPAVDVEARLRSRTILVTSAFGFEHPRPLPPGITMVGPCLPEQALPLDPEWDSWLSDGPPVVYANLGTVAIPHRRLLTTMAEAFAGVSASGAARRVLWVLRPSLAVHLPATLAPHVRVVDWGPPLPSVLAHPNVRAFVSHCGPNGAYESLAAQTPIVGIPMFADQSDVAARVVDAGIGVRLDKHRCTARQLRQAIDRVMTDASFRSSLAAVQQAIADTGGVRRAADIIERAAVSRESGLRAR